MLCLILFIFYTFQCTAGEEDNLRVILPEASTHLISLNIVSPWPSENMCFYTYPLVWQLLLFTGLPVFLELGPFLFFYFYFYILLVHFFTESFGFLLALVSFFSSKFLDSLHEKALDIADWVRNCWGRRQTDIMEFFNAPSPNLQSSVQRSLSTCVSYFTSSNSFWNQLCHA